MKRFGDRLRELRIERGLNQEELANIFHTGKASICNYEKNARLPDAEKIAAYAKFFDVSVDYILGKDDFRKPDNDLAFKLVVQKAKAANVSIERLLKLIDFLAEENK